jgi:outer membrane receptor protein involved in Fe transport
VPLRDIRYFDSAPGGAVDVDFDFLPDFIGEGLAWNPGIGGPPIFLQGGSGTPLWTYSGDTFPELERLAGNATFHYELTPRMRAFTEQKYVRTKSFSTSQPTFDFFLAIQPDNPFIPANIRSAFTASGAPFLLVSRDNFDLGIRGEDITRDTYRGVWGLDGDLGGGLNYEISYTYGRTDVQADITNNRFNDRFAAALDVVVGPNGQPTCASNLDPTLEPFNVSWQGFAAPTSFTPGPNSGCVPINIFGANSASAAARNWIMTDSVEQSVVQQQVANAYLSGNLDALFTLPGGSLTWAVGGEWRRETSRSTPPAEDEAGLTFGNIRTSERGAFEVKEGFVEFSAPILRDKPFFNSLALDGAARWSEYTTVGDTFTWKVGALWSPIEDFSFRATAAEAVRAPNIAELFQPQGQTFELIDDPCDIGELDQGTSTRRANCAALLSAFGIDPTTFTDPNSASVGGLLRGNRILKEETAETRTFGIVVQPRFAKRLTFSIDYYSIEIADAINTALAEELAELCVDAPNLNNQFCGFVTRDPATGGLDGFTRQPFNVANFRTEGVDFSASWTIDPQDWGAQSDWGLFNLRLIGNKLNELSFISVPGAPRDFDEGEGGPADAAPEWQTAFDLTWERGPFTVNYGVNYFSETQRFTTQQRAGEPDIAEARYLDYERKLTHDVQARYAINDGLSVYLGVNNLGDQLPDVGESAYPVGPLGRFWYLGFRTNVPSLRDLVSR